MDKIGETGLLAWPIKPAAIYCDFTSIIAVNIWLPLKTLLGVKKHHFWCILRCQQCTFLYLSYTGLQIRLCN